MRDLRSRATYFAVFAVFSAIAGSFKGTADSLASAMIDCWPDAPMQGDLVFCISHAREGGIRVIDQTNHVDLYETSTDADGLVVLGLPPSAAERILVISWGDRLISDGRNLQVRRRTDELPHFVGRDRPVLQSTNWLNEPNERAAPGYLSGFIFPVAGELASTYCPASSSGSERTGDDCRQVTISVLSDSPVLAPASGVVDAIEHAASSSETSLEIDHGGGIVTRLVFVGASSLETGQWVECGEQIGVVATDGSAETAWVRWEMRYYDRFFVDPVSAVRLSEPRAHHSWLQYLRARVQSIRSYSAPLTSSDADSDGLAAGEVSDR